MSGTEALIRWLDPDLGLIYPGQFVPIGRCALREACRQQKAWLESGLPPRYLELELTENILMNDAESSAAALEKISRYGSPPATTGCDSDCRAERISAFHIRLGGVILRVAHSGKPASRQTIHAVASRAWLCAPPHRTHVPL